MSSEHDEYDVFLDNWEPSEILEHATLASNLHDPFALARLLEDSTGAANLTRIAFVGGTKMMTDVEEQLRKYKFFEAHHASWSEHFRDQVISKGVDAANFDQFVHCFATDWVDGQRRRQDSLEMMAIKASIRDHDRQYHGKHAGRFVLSPVADNVTPLFAPWEMAVIFEENSGLLESLIPDYLDELEGDRGGSINRLYLRRGVRMPAVPGPLREELHYLSSYSLALSPVEQFAQTWTKTTKDTGVPAIFSAPLPALQMRVVAFAPFIKGMDLRQLELVVAPPLEATMLKYRGTHGGIRDYEFE